MVNERKESKNVSSRIALQKLSNTRDLGGMHTKDGRTIACGKLIRSGHLHLASPEDIAYISDHTELILDFRTENERQEKPNPVIPHAEILPLPIFERLLAGISRDEKSDKAALSMLAHNPDQARRYMMNTYLGFVTNEFAISQYRRFIELLSVPRKKAVLWHCTAGKDRAGFASVLVEEILGISRDDIMADYLKTNEYLADEISQLYAMVGQQMKNQDEHTETALHYLFGAHEEYLTALYEKTKDLYGGFDGFLEKAIGLSREKTDTLREQYLG